MHVYLNENTLKVDFITLGLDPNLVSDIKYNKEYWGCEFNVIYLGYFSNEKDVELAINNLLNK